MAKLKESFRMTADRKYNAAIEEFFTKHGIDFTVDETSVTQDYVVLDSEKHEPVSVVNTEVLNYDAEHDVLPIRLTMSDGSVNMVNINTDAYAAKLPGAGQTQTSSEPLTGLEDAESYEYNTQLINGFIQFLLPYKLDASAQEFLLSVMQEALDSCDEIRAGLANVTDETYKTLLDKLNTKVGGNDR